MVKNVSLSGKKIVDFENKNLHTSSYEEVENLEDCSNDNPCGDGMSINKGISMHK